MKMVDREYFNPMVTTTTFPINADMMDEIKATVDGISDRINEAIIDDAFDILRKSGYVSKDHNGPMTYAGKEKRIAKELKAYYSKNYVIFKYQNDTYKYSLPFEAENYKFQAFCIGLTKLYYKTLKDIFEDDIQVIKSDRLGPITEVFFSDGTTTRCMPDHRNEYLEDVGFYICFCKKMLGSTTVISELVKRTDAVERAREHKENLRRTGKEARENHATYLKQEFEYKVKQKMAELRIEMEARRRLEREPEL